MAKLEINTGFLHLHILFFSNEVGISSLISSLWSFYFLHWKLILLVFILVIRSVVQSVHQINRESKQWVHSEDCWLARVIDTYSRRGQLLLKHLSRHYPVCTGGSIKFCSKPSSVRNFQFRTSTLKRKSAGFRHVCGSGWLQAFPFQV